ncbi:MAG: rhodanese-like domain-containing protein [Alysiella sp.]|uniref:rhodanese-like domain-containing protein n=1 Tax=Alysiella sp. TaxID=1872483 RepID=UPI0026DCEADB|nr:rhodanese-like domain-containing protein [Alysiella sp.]MDO4434257.1 rhodanese-like domain-containing protein [Alysiella sp.]
MRKNLLILSIASILFHNNVLAHNATTPAKTTAQASIPKAKGLWIDVRSPEEFAQGHLTNAINVPLDQITQRISQISPNKHAPINLYCRSGRRAEVALQELKKLGYQNVTNHGGYDDLLKKGFK